MFQDIGDSSLRGTWSRHTCARDAVSPSWRGRTACHRAGCTSCSRATARPGARSAAKSERSEANETRRSVRRQPRRTLDAHGPPDRSPRRSSSLEDKQTAARRVPADRVGALFVSIVSRCARRRTSNTETVRDTHGHIKAAELASNITTSDPGQRQRRFHRVGVAIDHDEGSGVGRAPRARHPAPQARSRAHAGRQPGPESHPTSSGRRPR